MNKATVFFLLILVSCSCENKSDSSGLWPEIEPYQTDYLQVSDVHRIYYELCGNPEGRPVFVLHGGPGGSCSPYMRRFFNPEKFHIVLHDQRGAGRSEPYAELRENTTWDLVEDIERLRLLLKLDKILLFGGSWGSTLALAYAETYPQAVDGMVLRGLFTATQDEIDFFYHGGVAKFFPEVYEKFVNSLPDPDRRPLPEYLLTLVQSEDSTTRARYSRVWAEYETKLAHLFIPDEEVEKIFERFDPTAFASIENYYMANNCFLTEGQLWRQVDRIRDIPMIIVNGRYDVICPPQTAYRLHRECPNSRVVFAEEGGHSMGEKPVARALLAAMKEFE